MKFSELGLNQQLLHALDQAGYTTPTPIQEKSIPHILKGKDIFGTAQTGTGKTAAFALPVLQLISAKKQAGEARKLNTLVLAPTRELALQISESFATYSKHSDIKFTAIFGGVSQHKQTSAIRQGVDILIATPGRLLDLMQQGYIRLNTIEHFILDEADKMLDMGFIRDIKRIIVQLPKEKQSLFFSATTSKDVIKLSHSILNNPAHVSVTPESSASEMVDQRVYFVEKSNKSMLLRHVLEQEKMERVLVFTRTKSGADRIARYLNKTGIKAEAIHGNKSQNARSKALDSFKNKNISVLVATDIVSRGIDVDKLSFVINYEIPEQAETYVHRIGRTGRAGEAGIALSFCAEEELSYMANINKLIRLNIPVVESHPFTA